MKQKEMRKTTNVSKSEASGVNIIANGRSREQTRYPRTSNSRMQKGTIPLR